MCARPFRSYPVFRPVYGMADLHRELDSEIISLLVPMDPSLAFDSNGHGILVVHLTGIELEGPLLQ